jgi:hypothetical protein
VLAGPPTPEAPPPSATSASRGLVLERLPAGPYTYLQVATGTGARWVVTMGSAPEGAVEVRNMGIRKRTSTPAVSAATSTSWCSASSPPRSDPSF